MSFFAKRQTAAGSSTTAAAAAAAAAQKPWIEKYRPKTMDDISSQEQAVAVLKKTMESQNLPHLLFYGPPGTGKTSTILALARDIYGPEMIGSRVLELNASDERGIQVIREKVKNFARSTVTHNIGNQNCPPYKIIILDEADSMTSDAQSALRRTMETYSKLTRFCLICNYVTRIIEPLASRCAKFRFRPLEEKHSKERLELICQQESVKISPEAILSLIRVSEGDLRKAIMHLQSVSRLVGKDAEIDSAMIADIAGTVPESVIDGLEACWRTKDYKKISSEVQNVVADGYSAARVLSQLHTRLLKNDSLDSMQKAKIAEIFGDMDKALSDGADEQLQLLNMMTRISAIAA
ncbi:hypothetical protein BGZ80_002416 [Entomortierella chlamydospora]|uniref:Replication factor C subunit 2 n=1 Tax=Entomortierella chlamydospora TaxID=101097 RepID=A0A9P6MQD7_9FUNG|nr:hypothetical protein BGZ79_004670 [Entomortierella chlamydospora]KAG0009407.1 hypothetical protein BGZ80_002416 [Entomortierella chlamydospora]